jgi:hypothetical protein
VLGQGGNLGSYLRLLRRVSVVARLFTGIAWLFAIAMLGTFVANELSDDPEYYVPVIAGLIAVVAVLLARHFRR